MSKTTKTAQKDAKLKDAKLKRAMDAAWEKKQAAQAATKAAAQAQAMPKGKQAKDAPGASAAAEPTAEATPESAEQRSAAPKPAKAPQAPKAPREPKTPKAKKPKKLSCLDAAAQLLAEERQPMGCQDLIDRMAERGLWTSPGGKTPASTLYAAVIREIAAKGADSRFAKADRGLFAATGK